MIKIQLMKTLKKNISFLTILIFSFLSGHAQSVDLIANVDVTPPLNNGQTFNYSIMSTGSPYNSLRIKLIYDPSVIQLNSLTPVYAFSFTPVNDTSTPGLIKYEATLFSGNITTDEIIFTVEFEVLDNNQSISIAHNYDAADGTVVVNSGGNDILGTANDILLETLSIDTNTFENSLTVYPNPVKNDLIIVNTNNEIGLKSIRIHTMDGKLILDKTNFNHEFEGQDIHINTSYLKNALYLMSITNNQGAQKIYKILVAH